MEKNEVLSENRFQSDEKTEKVGKKMESGSAPDGGWGWMVVLGCTLMHFLVGGCNRSYGVLKKENSIHNFSGGSGEGWPPVAPNIEAPDCILRPRLHLLTLK